MVNAKKKKEEERKDDLDEKKAVDEPSDTSRQQNPTRGKGKKGKRRESESKGKGKRDKPLKSDDPKKESNPAPQSMAQAIAALTPAPIPRSSGAYDVDCSGRDNVSLDHQEFTRFVPMQTEHMMPLFDELYDKQLREKLGQSINVISFTREMFRYFCFTTVIQMWYIQHFNMTGEKIRMRCGLAGMDMPSLKRFMSLDVNGEEQWGVEEVMAIIRPYIASRLVETPLGLIREIPIPLIDTDAVSFLPDYLGTLLNSKLRNEEMTNVEYAAHYPFAANADPLAPVANPGYVQAARWEAVEQEKRYIRSCLGHLHFGTIENRTAFNRIFRFDLVTESHPIFIGHLRACALQSLAQQGFSEAPSEYTQRPQGIPEARLRALMTGVCGYPETDDADIAAYAARRFDAGYINVGKNITQTWNYWSDARIHRLMLQSSVALSSGQRNLTAASSKVSIQVEAIQPTISIIVDQIDGLDPTQNVVEDKYDVMMFRQGAGHTLKIMGIDCSFQREMSVWLFRAMQKLKPCKLSFDETGGSEKMLPTINQGHDARVPIPAAIGALANPPVTNSDYNQSMMYFKSPEMMTGRSVIVSNPVSGVVSRWVKPRLVAPDDYELNPTAVGCFVHITTAAYVPGGPEIERVSENLITDGGSRVTIPRHCWLKGNSHRLGYVNPHLYLRVTDSQDGEELKYTSAVQGFSTTRGEPVFSI